MMEAPRRRVNNARPAKLASRHRVRQTRLTRNNHAVKRDVGDRGESRFEPKSKDVRRRRRARRKLPERSSLIRGSRTPPKAWPSVRGVRIEWI
jgi:hypothetical protein